MLTFGSLFTGIGGFDLGFQNAGLKGIWQCEIDKAAQSVLRKWWPEVELYDDVTTISHAMEGGQARRRERGTGERGQVTDTGDGERSGSVLVGEGRTVERPDLIAGGFPCQDLSIAGSRAGLAGDRSGLFYEFMRIAGEFAPRWVVIENVPGLLSSNGGRDMGAVLGTLANLGYGFAYRVLDSQYFGLAQRRQRVFIAACLGDAARAAQVLLESAGLPGDPPPGRTSGEEIARPLGAKPTGWRGDLDNDTYVAHALTERHDSSEDGTGRGLPLVSSFQQNRRGEVRSYDVSTPLTTGGGIPGQGYPAIETRDLGGVPGVRRLTPRECERLQGFPDDWTAEGIDGPQSDSARYRQLGNAVSVPVAEWIARRILATYE